MKWGHAEITRLLVGARRNELLSVIGQRAQCTAKQADLALWAKVGRTIEETCDRLNGGRQ